MTDKEKQARTSFSKPVRFDLSITDSRSPNDTEVELLQFKIPKNIKWEFKQKALDERITMTELFLQMYASYK